jgi:hypothetical protein
MSLSIKRQIIVGMCVLLTFGLGTSGVIRWREAEARARFAMQG